MLKFTVCKAGSRPHHHLGALAAGRPMSQMERMYEIDRLLKGRRATPLEVFMENTSA